MKGMRTGREQQYRGGKKISLSNCAKKVTAFFRVITFFILSSKEIINDSVLQKSRKKIFEIMCKYPKVLLLCNLKVPLAVVFSFSLNVFSLPVICLHYRASQP